MKLIFCLQVNNAGVNFNVGSDNSIESAHMVVATNYYGTKNMMKAMIPLMRPSAMGARIVNVSSRLGKLSGRRNVSRLLLLFLRIWKEKRWFFDGQDDLSVVISFSSI